jgi:transposase
MAGLRPVVADQQLMVLRILADRHRSLGEDHIRMVCQLHQLLLELIPGGAKKSLSAAQAKALLARVRPRDAAGRARRQVAAELISDLERVYQRTKAAAKELTALLQVTGTTLTSLQGIGPSGAARLLIEAGDITRFPTRAHFASWNGTAPIGASSGDQVRHRLSRAGNRQINWVLHIMAVAPAPQPHRGPRLFRSQSRRRQNTDGSDARPQTSALRHRLPPDDPRRPDSSNGPGRTLGAATGSSAAGSNPLTGASEKSLPGPAANHPTPPEPPILQGVPDALHRRRAAAARTAHTGEPGTTTLLTEGSNERTGLAQSPLGWPSGPLTGARVGLADRRPGGPRY